MPPIDRPDARFNQFAYRKICKHAAQRLFGDRKQTKQLAYRHARLPRDEIQGTVMRSAKPVTRQFSIDAPRQVAIAEIQKFDATPDFAFA